MSIHFRTFKEVPDAWKPAVWKAMREQSDGEKKVDVLDSNSVAKSKRDRQVQEMRTRPVPIPPFTSRVGLRVHCYRNRLLDGDNTDIKALQDSLVAIGIVADDTTEEIEWQKVTQTKNVKVKD